MRQIVTWTDVTDGVMEVVLNQGPVNALGPDLCTALHGAIDAAEHAEGLHIVIIRSEVPKFFAAGADIGVMAKITRESFAEFLELICGVNDRIADAPWLTIAALDGFALGGGLELALACTMRVAGPGAKLGLPEVKLGLIPGAGGTQRLTRLVGRARATDMILTARTVRAEEALAIGLVDRFSPDGAIVAARELAAELRVPSRLAQLAAIRSMNAAQDLSLADGLVVERDEVLAQFVDGDVTEGLAAFLEKRTPNF